MPPIWTLKERHVNFSRNKVDIIFMAHSLGRCWGNVILVEGFGAETPKPVDSCISTLERDAHIGPI